MVTWWMDDISFLCGMGFSLDDITDFTKKNDSNVSTFRKAVESHLERGGNISDWLKEMHEGNASKTSARSEVVALLVKKTVNRRDGSTEETILTTAENFRIIFENDPHFSNVRYNSLRGYPERIVNGQRLQWTDSDDSEARVYIETVYGIASRAKAEDAFSVFLRGREYHPVQTEINKFKADGQEHCATFLIKWMGAEDTPYNREVSRLLFAGGINRTYRPGCKFDCVPVLIGAQGAGKSTLCQWLALSPDFYSSAKTISGQKGLEGIQGKFVVELEELLAVLANERQGQKVEEAAKAFLSSSSDFYRKPYDRRPIDNPRSCVFVGTTNRDTFLTDKTGNRRWFPVRCNGDGNRLFENEKAVKRDIELCWAEMRDAFFAGDALASPTPQMQLLTTIKEQQTSAEIDDFRAGLFEEYLKGKERICLYQLWKEVLYPDSMTVPELTRRHSCELAEILTNSLGWLRGNVENFGKYGRQKAFIKPSKDGMGSNSATEGLPF